MTINERVSPERLNTIKSWRETYGQDANVMIPASEAESIISELQQYRAAAACPAVWVRYGDANHAPDCTLDNDEAREWVARGLDVVRMVSPINAAPQVTSVSLLIQFSEFMAAESIKSGDYPDGWQCKASNAAYEYAQVCGAAPAVQAEPDYRDIVERVAVVLHGSVTDLALLPVSAQSVMDKVTASRNSGIAIDAGNIQAERDALNEPTCWCRTCRPITVTDMRFVVCPECGNKRCPHANDHRNACTGSNEPGQEGSAYPDAPKQEAE